MSETKNPPSDSADWAALRQQIRSSGSGTDWTTLQYKTVVDLIKHCDNQIDTGNRYHLMGIGSMIPLLAILLKINVPLYTHVGLMFLGCAIGIRWLTQTSKLSLEKLCWVSLARQMEESCSSDPFGPFMAQREFFNQIPAQMSGRDRFIMHRMGTRRLYFISVIFVTFALVAAGLAALASGLSLPF